MLKQQIQKKLSTFCHLCLVQWINSSLICFSHVKFFFFLFYVEKNILIQKMAVGRGRAGGPLPPFPIALNTLIDNAEDLDIFMPIYNLLEYSQNYSMTSESLWNFYCCYFVY